MEASIERAIEFLNLHHRAFFEVQPFAEATEHPTPSDTAAWSEILASLLLGIPGYAQKKGPDLADGSDVKAANTWGTIDTPRFNRVIKAGTKSEHSGQLSYLDTMPYLVFVLWDNEPDENRERCRVWVVRPQKDKAFRKVCARWYQKRDIGEIKSDNFQLHPPSGKNSNEFRNTCGNLYYPLLLNVVWSARRDTYEVIRHNTKILEKGTCRKATV